MYKEASKLKLRVLTTKGELSPEQLWDLSVTDLDSLAVKLDQEYKESGKKSFLVRKSSKDKVSKLKLDIVIDILTTKVEEAESAKDALDIKAHNQKIMGLIAKKQEGELEGKSISELEKMLK